MVDRIIDLERVRPAPSAPDANTETRYRVRFEGREIGVWRDPTCSAARFLLDRDLASRGDVLRTFRGDAPCMRGSVAWFADRKVTEKDRQGGTPRFVKWTSNPFAALPRSEVKLACRDFSNPR